MGTSSCALQLDCGGDAANSAPALAASACQRPGAFQWWRCPPALPPRRKPGVPPPLHLPLPLLLLLAPASPLLPPHNAAASLLAAVAAASPPAGQGMPAVPGSWGSSAAHSPTLHRGPSCCPLRVPTKEGRASPGQKGGHRSVRVQSKGASYPGGAPRGAAGGKVDLMPGCSSVVGQDVQIDRSAEGGACD